MEFYAYSSQGWAKKVIARFYAFEIEWSTPMAEDLEEKLSTSIEIMLYHQNDTDTWDLRDLRPKHCTWSCVFQTSKAFCFA